MNWRLMAPMSNRPLLGADPLFSLHRELSKMFDDILPSSAAAGSVAAASSMLRLDVKEDEKKFTVTVDLPGMSEKDVEVTFQDGLLTVRGEKKVERDEKKDTWHLIERSCGSFARQLSMPANIDSDKIEARFDKGVLTVSLPKMPDEQTKAKKIEIIPTSK